MTRAPRVMTGHSSFRHTRSVTLVLLWPTKGAISSIVTPELDSKDTKLCRNSRGVHSLGSSPAALATRRNERRTLAASSANPCRVQNTRPQVIPGLACLLPHLHLFSSRDREGPRRIGRATCLPSRAHLSAWARRHTGARVLLNIYERERIAAPDLRRTHAACSAGRPSSENGCGLPREERGEQMIVVLDGMRDAPGACAWCLMSSSGAGQAAAVAAGLSVGTWLIRDSYDATSDGFLDAVDVVRIRHLVRIYSGGL